jgi:glycerate 2-kinase
MTSRDAQILRDMFGAAVDAAMPHKVIGNYLPAPPRGRVVVVGAGKASAAMARAFEEAWEGPLSGLVVTRYDHAVACAQIKIVEAAHPVPDENGRRAARDILNLAEGLGQDDLMVALISGGGSSLLSLPAEGLSLADKQAVNAALLKSGATISQMNCVRKHLSAIKGGRLAAAAWPARTLTLTISDVPGDNPSIIASGPTVGDTSTLADALHILRPLAELVPKSVLLALENQANETPDLSDPRLSNTDCRIISAPQISLEAAADVARQSGLTPLILGDAIEGEAREVGIVMAGIAKSAQKHGHPLPAPCVLISGGETTVTVRGQGRGGRNVEFLLGLASALDSAPGISAIACDTDGVDGAEDVAGAIVHPQTLQKASDVGYPLADALANNDGHGFFQAINDQVITGPTLTNVNDFRAIIVRPA